LGYGKKVSGKVINPEKPNRRKDDDIPAFEFSESSQSPFGSAQAGSIPSLNDSEGIENSGEEDIALLWGANLSGSNVPNYWTGGVEEIFMFRDKTRATYRYGGEGSVFGEGASVTVYGGMVFNIENPEDYRENSAAVGITLSILEKGVTISYFWNTNEPPLTPGNVQGFTIGYSPGAQASIWSTVTYYEVWEIIR
jgi:hypothetical protein